MASGGETETLLGQDTVHSVQLGPGITSFGGGAHVPIVQQPLSTHRRFDPSLLDSSSKPVYYSISDFHKSSARLQTCIDQLGGRMLQKLDASSSAIKGHMTFEELLHSLSHDGEHVLTNDWRLLYSHVTIFDCENEGGKVLEELPSGAAILTNKRLLLLSASAGQGMQLTAVNQKKVNRVYKMAVANLDNVVYKPLPLRNVASVEMSAATGARIEGDITATPPCCCGLCSCFSCICESAMKQWSGTLGGAHTYNQRVLKIGVRLPPWDRRVMVQIEISGGLPLSVARDFIVLLQRHSPISGNL